MSRRGTLAALAACAWLAGPAGAALIDTRLDDPALAARIDGAPLYTLSVDALARAAREKTPGAPRAAALQTAIMNRLLAALARRDFKAEELHPSTRVTFQRDVAADDKLAASLRAQYGKELEAALRALPGASLNGLVRESFEPEPAAWERVFGKGGKLQLEYVLSAEQQAQAKKTILLRYKLPAGQSGDITLYDVYRRQNVQGRVELFNRNQPYLRQQARLKLANLFVLHWATQQFGAKAVDDLRQTLGEQDEVLALLALHGIGDDIEGESALLGRLAKQVGAAEIGAYYRSHKEEFRRIERVKARHIRVADERLGKEVVAAAAKGEDFGALARRHSTADDAKAGGELGWIVHEGKLSWLQQLAFMQPEGQVSRPYRGPVAPDQAASWEIVLVEQRVQGYQAPDSEAVKYTARKAVAREKAAAQMKALRERVLHDAAIEVDGKQLDAPLQLGAST
ncbi:peptidylprolyl isomerase [Janthinobacterium fluminis]|uniref:peptidylprolyl isomerase n=1 Tax=Janthinobacterium fluminis TaxID=2987524 RepID=A0ABT5JZB6_9BURK|nr:peptidylprolyl isomerase [Janthinobacterium fluminis]MDC8757540.1 peptidylprolyl isomerase [Janthinobacterium fluminis]